MSDEVPRPSGDCITDRMRQNRAKAKAESSCAASGSADLVRRLQALYHELKREEMDFHKKGNDEGECATYAAAERLKEVVQGFIGETQIKNDDRLVNIERLLVEVVGILAGNPPNEKGQR